MKVHLVSGSFLACAPPSKGAAAYLAQNFLVLLRGNAISACVLGYTYKNVLLSEN